MTADDVIAALDLPPTARVDRRVPKSLLLEHGAPTAADKRNINEGIEQILWVASLKPTTIGVAAHRDETREYLEIAVLRMALRAAARLARLMELLHRAIPYPVIAISALGDRVNLSVAHKRWSQGEAGKIVLDDEVISVDCPGTREPQATAFQAALALNRQPRDSIFALYQGWMDTLLALESARLTHTFEVPVAEERRAARREALRECSRLKDEIARLRAAAAKEKQIPKQVDLNLELKRAEAARAVALARL
jgi:hypothetical protein